PVRGGGLAASGIPFLRPMHLDNEISRRSLAKGANAVQASGGMIETRWCGHRPAHRADRSLEQRDQHVIGIGMGFVATARQQHRTMGVQLLQEMRRTLEDRLSLKWPA